LLRARIFHSAGIPLAIRFIRTAGAIGSIVAFDMAVRR
jgi:hypothetical protein